MNNSKKEKSSSRRKFLLTGASLAVAGAGASVQANEIEKQGEKMLKPKVIFLDVNETTLDLKMLKTSVGKALNGKEELLPLWFSTMLHHSLVATVGDHYEDFGAIGAAALQMVACGNGIKISKEDAVKAVSPIRKLPAHPDVKPALKLLKDSGIRLMTLTNSSNSTVNAQMKNAGLESYLEQQLSIEDLGIYKPHTHTYKWAARKVNTELSECMLVAAHGWDVAGASWAGMRTAFVSRPGQSMYPLASKPEIVVPDFSKLADLLLE